MTDRIDYKNWTGAEKFWFAFTVPIWILLALLELAERPYGEMLDWVRKRKHMG